MDRRIWEVDFDVIGPISIERKIQFKQEKGFDPYDPFYSDIELSKCPYGFKATITAYADTIDIAETVAYVFFGRMRDVLSLINDMPIQLHKNEGLFNSGKRFASRRKLKKTDIIEAFKLSRELEVLHPTLLRAIGWYSKGKLSHNAIDQFFAFWNVVEILGKKYHVETERTKGGKTKNQIYQCFEDYFGPLSEWKLPEGWIDNMYSKRNMIFHGGEDTTLDAINEISKMIPLLERTSKDLINNIIDKEYKKIHHGLVITEP